MSEEKLNSLAKRIDTVCQKYDFYDYKDNDGSFEEVKQMLIDSPESVIDGLIDMIENLL